MAQYGHVLNFHLLCLQTIDDFLYHYGPSIENKYLERYNCNSRKIFQPTKTELKEPTKKESDLRDKLIGKYSEALVEMLDP